MKKKYLWSTLAKDLPVKMFVAKGSQHRYLSLAFTAFAALSIILARTVAMSVSVKVEFGSATLILKANDFSVPESGLPLKADLWQG